MALQDDWNGAVSAFNDAGYEINTIQKIWGILTAAQKTTIKNSVLAVLDTTKTNIDALKTQISAL